MCNLGGMNEVIEVTGLIKNFGRTRALDGLDLRLGPFLLQLPAPRCYSLISLFGGFTSSSNRSITCSAEIPFASAAKLGRMR